MQWHFVKYLVYSIVVFHIVKLVFIMHCHIAHSIKLLAAFICKIFERLGLQEIIFLSNFHVISVKYMHCTLILL